MANNECKNCRPLSFAEVPRQASDFLTKDFVAAGVKVDVKSKTTDNLQFNVIGSHDLKTDALNAEIKCRFANAPQGITITESWNNKNKINTEIEFADKIAKGLKLNATGALFTSNLNARTAKLAAEYRAGPMATRAVVDIPSGDSDAGITATTDIALTHGNFVVGAEVAMSRTGVRRFGTAFGYRGPNYSFTMLAGNPANSPVAASFYHRVTRDLELGGRVTYNCFSGKKSSEKAGLITGSGSSSDPSSFKKMGEQALFELAVKKTHVGNAFFKGKVDSVGRLSLAYSTPLNDGFKITVGSTLDYLKLNDPNALKLGVMLAFEG